MGTIQTSIDLLPATGAEVRLLDGTYNILSNLVMDTNQTLKGCGWNTILTTSTYDLQFITATGSDGSEKTGIIIANLQIDGDGVSDIGIYFNYVDCSLIQNAYCKDHTYGGIGAGIILELSDYNIVTNNLCTGNDAGIESATGHRNIISNNICKGNYAGIWFAGADYNLVNGNLCQGNDGDGILLESSDHNDITANFCLGNSQKTDNTWDDIHLGASDYNNIQGNICRAGGETNKPKYGIDINAATCDGNKVINNDLYDDGFGTGPFNDSGTGTIYVEPGIDDTPVNGETGQPISSNWAYDHENSTTAHGGFIWDAGVVSEDLTYDARIAFDLGTSTSR